MYVNADGDAGSGPRPGVGGSTGLRITTRPSVIQLWEVARAALNDAGAEIVDVDFSVVSIFEGDRGGAPMVVTRGIVPPEYLHAEKVELAAWAWDDFLAANGDPELNDLAEVDGAKSFRTRPRRCRTGTTGSSVTSVHFPTW